MKNLKYPTIGAAALSVYALGNVLSLLSRYDYYPQRYSALISLAVYLVAMVLAEVWAVLYWRRVKSNVAVVVLVAMSVVFASSLVAVVPEVGALLRVATR